MFDQFLCLSMHNSLTVQLYMVVTDPIGTQAPWCASGYYQMCSSPEVALRKANIMQGQAYTCTQTLWSDGSEYRTGWTPISAE